MAADSTSSTALARSGARERLTLLLARFIGGGYVAFLISFAPSIRREYFEYAHWWPVLAVVLTFGPPVWMMWPACVVTVSALVGRRSLVQSGTESPPLPGRGTLARCWAKPPQPPWLG